MGLTSQGIFGLFAKNEELNGWSTSYEASATSCKEAEEANGGSDDDNSSDKPDDNDDNTCDISVPGETGGRAGVKGESDNKESELSAKSSNGEEKRYGQS